MYCYSIILNLAIRTYDQRKYKEILKDVSLLWLQTHMHAHIQTRTNTDTRLHIHILVKNKLSTTPILTKSFSFLRVWLRPGPGLASTNSTESTWKCCLSLLSRYYVIVCYYFVDLTNRCATHRPERGLLSSFIGEQFDSHKKWILRSLVMRNSWSVKFCSSKLDVTKLSVLWSVHHSGHTAAV